MAGYLRGILEGSIVFTYHCARSFLHFEDGTVSRCVFFHFLHCLHKPPKILYTDGRLGRRFPLITVCKDDALGVASAVLRLLWVRGSDFQFRSIISHPGHICWTPLMYFLWYDY
jgi:hypothetical protein